MFVLDVCQAYPLRLGVSVLLLSSILQATSNQNSLPEAVTPSRLRSNNMERSPPGHFLKLSLKDLTQVVQANQKSDPRTRENSSYDFKSLKKAFDNF